jgi:tetratricopeptide (TPR) repeat protein
VHVRSAIAIAERLAALDPWDQNAKSELGQYLSSGGEELGRPEDWAESVKYERRALPIFQTLLKVEPDSGVYQLYAALIEADLGDRLSQRNQTRVAIEWLRRGLTDITRLTQRDPRNTTHFLELLKIQRMLVACLARAGQGSEAIALANDVIAKAQSLVNQSGDGRVMARSGADLELPRAYAAMAEACRALGRREEARKWYRTALAEWETMRSAGFVSAPDTEQEMEDSRKGAEN